MYYVDVILPLPLEGLFTYAVDDGLAAQVVPGARVRVPLGRSKAYVGVVVRLHQQQPAFQTKPVTALLDKQPVLLPMQLRLWQWMADYYMSPLGEVMTAALPAALRQVDGYRPRTETWLRLAPTFQNEQALHVALNMLARATQQLKTLETFLFLTVKGEEGAYDGAVSREELMNEAHCTASAVRALLNRKILVSFEREVGRLNRTMQPAGQPANADIPRAGTAAGTSQPKVLKTLSEAQAEAYNQILMQFMRKRVVLLHGVTSSGKTEIYIHLISRALERGQQVLYLLPEIALTVQMMERLRRVFGPRMAVYHSKYSDAERVEIWQKQLSDEPYGLILGARSAVFLPFQRLGLIIVDEEHETSFKQQDPMPRYHARSAAIMLASFFGDHAAPNTEAPHVLLGTATPSAETWHNAQTGKYGLVRLTTRYQDIAMPAIEVVDVKDLTRRKMMNGLFSPQLLAAMRQAFAAGRQVILFQNRRGFAPQVECRQCGWVPKCQNCDVSLTLHKRLGQLTCHYCGFTYQVPSECPCCGGTDLRGRGYGTEKVEDQIREIFPEARIARMDLDTTRTRSAYERLICDFSAGRTNLLIGTQMVTKGLDFGGVSVVGILNADNMLNMPDFRAYEHAFTMMAQVSGRAGRKGRQGRVFLQTKQPDLPLINQVVTGNQAAFYADLLAERETFHYPPFFRLVYVFLRHRDESLVESAALELAGRLRQWFGTRVLGPDKPAVARVKQLAIRKIVLKLEGGINLPRVRECLSTAQKQMGEVKRYAALQIYFDVDPL